ncbi:MAG: hypothetical protein KDC59_00415 [Saprospiraceae bacterium]|nr:hypothetical protein [Saprospiraceae bacterium]HPG05371.1 hypothetical protein [Saprospiraceae bacterium]
MKTIITLFTLTLLIAIQPLSSQGQPTIARTEFASSLQKHHNGGRSKTLMVKSRYGKRKTRVTKKYVAKPKCVRKRAKTQRQAARRRSHQSVRMPF